MTVPSGNMIYSQTRRLVLLLRLGLSQAGLNEEAELVREVLFSNQASTADGVLKSRRDVCFSCPFERCCLPLQNVNDPYDTLVEYRYSDLDTLLAKRYPGEAWRDCLVKDWMIAKFFLPYTITVTTKRWMLRLALLGNVSTVLDKSHGKYCPKEDRWKLEATAFKKRGGRAWRT